jgi:prepilin-type N-terminal cleavage/methylation domain-containing protein
LQFSFSIKESLLKVKGFTLPEILVVIVLSSIILGAIVGLFISSENLFKKTKPVSDVLEEMRSGLATLDFVFSRWGAGVPCKNNQCQNNSNIVPCDDFPPSDPLCMNCTQGDFSSGCSEVVFYGNLYGLGFVVDNKTGNMVDIISCRLENDYKDDKPRQCYYIWHQNGVITDNSTNKPLAFSFNSTPEFNSNNTDCINFNKTPNLTIPAEIDLCNSSITYTSNTTYTLQPGDIIVRSTQMIKLYVKQKKNGYWLIMEKTDIEMSKYYGIKSSINPIAKLKDADSFKVYMAGKGVRIRAIFASQSSPSQFFEIIKYYGR